MRVPLACLLILALQPAIAFAGQSGFAQQKEDYAELWRIRSQGFTDDLLKDAGQLSTLRRAVLWTRLAQRWWREDPRRARGWLINAIETVERVPNKENPEEREDRLRTARLILTVVAPLEQKLAQRLVACLSNDEKSAGKERVENAEGLLDAALAVVTADPKRAAEMGSLALRLGPPNDISSLLFELRAREPKLAESLFVQALSLAKQDPSWQWLNTLTYAAFPTERGLRANLPAFPEHLRVEVLQLLVASINATPFNGENQNLICAGLARHTAPLLSEFERLLPQQTPVVRQAINKCQSVAPLVQQELDTGLGEESLKTVDGLLKAAGDAKDVRVRTVYQFRAASLAKDAKNYDLAFKILDGMDKEQRDFMGEAWISFRWDWASGAAIEYYRSGRLLEMNQLLNAVPTEAQVFAKIAFLNRLPEPTDADPAPIVQVLNDAIVALGKSSVPDQDKYNWYFGLLRSTVKYQPTEARVVLKAAVSSLNKTNDQKTLDTTAYTEGIAEPLLEMDQYVVKESLDSVTPVETRAQLRLVLLAASLRQMKGSQK